MKITAIIQARTSSVRLPGKIFLELGGKTMLENIVERVRRSKYINDLVVATSDMASDDKVEILLRAEQIDVFRGSLENVLERFYVCAKQRHADVVIRLTADNALVSPEIIDESIHIFNEKKVDYLYYKTSLPLGMCIEVFSFAALKKAFTEAADPECLEHVTPYIKKNPKSFKILNYTDSADEDYSHLRFTVDTPQDYDFVSRIYNYFKDNNFSYADILNVLKLHPEWTAVNQNVVQKKVNYSGEKMMVSFFVQEGNNSVSHI